MLYKAVAASAKGFPILYRNRYIVYTTGLRTSKG